jgi:hypothetical protein
MFYIFGAAFLGREAGNVATIGMMINAFLLVTILYCIFRFKQLISVQQLSRTPLKMVLEA